MGWLQIMWAITMQVHPTEIAKGIDWKYPAPASLFVHDDDDWKEERPRGRINPVPL
jgi:hypothetical protein